MSDHAPTVHPYPPLAKVGGSRTSHPNRLRSDETVGETLRSVLRALDRSEAWLAQRMGCSGTELSRQLDGEHRLNTAQLENAPTVALAYYAARSEMLRAQHPVASIEREHRQLVASVGVLSSRLDDALADGRVSADEAAGIDAAVSGVIAEAVDVRRAVG